MKDRKVKQVFSWSVYQWEGHGHRKRVKEANVVDVFHIHV
jgi:hypothetical protein